MKVGVFTAMFRTPAFDEVLDYIISTGVDAIEIPCGGVLSIEHEDALMSSKEGFEKAVQVLRSLVIREDVGQPFWA